MRLSLGLKYVVSTTLILTLVMGLTMVVISKRHEMLVIDQLKIQAKALFQQVVITRRWVADHGGVFVEKLPWVEANPYLKDPLIIDRKGKEYVRENPAMVTRQLSNYAQKDRLFTFHLTSLKLLNPKNAPDDFESSSLREFEKGAKESSKIEAIGGAYYYRYIAPLYVEEGCLECHLKQGYKVGDVRGGISITLPMDSTNKVISADRRYMALGGVGTLIVLLAALIMMTRHMVINPVNRIRTLMSNYSRDGNPDILVLKTNDEIEDLYRSFADMAQSLDGYHRCLQDKINSATKELREKNETLVNLNRMKSDSIAKVSHELRTPLTSIKGAMDYIAARISMEGGEGREDLRVFFDVIKNNAERLIRLVNEVLDFERIELGSLGMRFEDTNLKDVFNDVVIGFRTQALLKNVEINFDAEDVLVYGDQDRLRQVLINLISNALNFSPEASEIDVSVREVDGQAVVKVADKGCGIPDGEKEMVFRQFYSRGVKKGAGLGLAICKGIVEAHKGLIGVESGDGTGSCFYFTLPIKK